VEDVALFLRLSARSQSACVRSVGARSEAGVILAARPSPSHRTRACRTDRSVPLA